MKLLKRLLFVLLLWGGFAHLVEAQVLVSITSSPYQQFLDNSGKPLAGGKVYTYNAGTTTLANSYTDSSGTTLNTDPIILDAAGVPANPSGVEVGIWLANQSYKFCIQNSLGVQLRCIDNIPGYAFGILNLANTWALGQTFSTAITITPTDNQIITGAPGNQTTVDFPPPTGNITLHFPSTGDTMVGRNTTDTLTNKTLTAPVINNAIETMPTINGAVVVNSPGTYAAIANANPTGTTVSTLTKLINSTAQATIAATTDTRGIIGITVSGAGNTGTAIVQESGLVNCVFDGATSAGDYVQISATVGGDCHDTGSATYPLTNQIVGRVMTTNGGGGTYQVLLFGPDIEGSSANSIGVTIANSGTGTSLSALTKLVNAPSQAQITSTGDTGGIIGITTAGAGTTGSAVVAQMGLINCQFDGATTAGDYVQNSPTVGGDCHDVGASYPTAGQVLGRVLSTNIGAGAYTVDLFPPEINAPKSILAQSTTTSLSTTAIGNSNATVITKAVTMPASGCPCRVQANWWLYVSTTNAGQDVAYVTDGTAGFAGSETATTGSASGYGFNGAGASTITYANNAVITFNLIMASSHSGGTTVSSSQLGTSITGAPASALNLVVYSSN
ncbi:MAG TPA: hypothetical protein VMQ17_08805 [Candidatus Sulfotelmatobacter sp.]|nr:hypothetical protein [Candidatus Sulfotelmatobacter sp.]